MKQTVTQKLNDLIAGIPEKVLLTVLLVMAGYGYFHFGIEDTVLFRSIQVLLLLMFVWIIVVRAGQPQRAAVRGTGRETDRIRESDLETIQRLAEHYQLQRRVDTEQDFRASLKRILGTVKNTFVSYSVLAYLWDVGENQFVLKEWVADDAELEVQETLPPDGYPISDIIEKNDVWIEGNAEESRAFPCCFKSDVPVKSILACPIYLENEIAGIIVLHSISQEAFGSDDEPLLRGFSEIIAQTILGYNRIYEFETSSRIFSTFYAISRELNSELKFDEILEILVRIVKEIFEFDRITISLLEEDKSHARIHMMEGEEDTFNTGFVFSLEEGLNGWVIRRNKSIVVSDLEKGEYFIPRYSRSEKSNFNIRSFLASPIGFSGKSLGAISIESVKPNMYIKRHEDILEMLSNNIGMALERSIIYKKLESMATTDGLTGLYNHQTFRLRLNEEINRARRYHSQFSLLMLDIDHFKLFNDSYGHLTGDEVLKRIAYFLRASLRNIDFVARYGGEEFCAILLNSTGNSARLSAERIRANIEENPFELQGKKLPATVSIGVASFPGDAEQEDDLINSADKALYRAKAGGRNRIMLYSDGLE